ncbi:MAG: hypothetical protein EOP51_10180 [Sphingobacteriales bacterium]|nr:MAG: hypothetical protein EOP51_10180 [Sphingobacteriales bacterium]
MKRLMLIFLSFLALQAHAQSLKTSFEGLNDQRIKTDRNGMMVLGSWGAANVVAGVTGMIVADGQEARSFHTMNAIWGAVNLSIAGLSYAGARRDMNKQLDCDKMLHRYEATKRLYLLNAGLDVLYIGTGVTLNAYANEFNDAARWRGYGKSIAVQGIALLLFDATMFSMHQKQDKNWYKLLQGVCVTGNGIGYRYSF